jgi:non-ribosomal peptide synthetase component E (peptide arylation enzyme)
MIFSIIVHTAGYYFTGDGAKRDTDGYYWITGRVDDVINPSGHRIGECLVCYFLRLLSGAFVRCGDLLATNVGYYRRL